MSRSDVMAFASIPEVEIALWVFNVWFGSAFLLFVCYTLREPYGVKWRGRDIAALVFAPLVVAWVLAVEIPCAAAVAVRDAVNRGW